MKFRAVRDSEYVRQRDSLIAKCEKIAYERTKNIPENAAKRNLYSRIFSISMQEEAERLHITDGMTPNDNVLLARALKINVAPSGVIQDYLDRYEDPLGDDDASD